CERQPQAGFRWLDPCQSPHDSQQDTPGKARVTLDRRERRRVPNQAAPREPVRDVPERDVRVVRRKKRQPPAGGCRDAPNENEADDDAPRRLVPAEAFGAIRLCHQGGGDFGGPRHIWTQPARTPWTRPRPAPMAGAVTTNKLRTETSVFPRGFRGQHPIQKLKRPEPGDSGSTLVVSIRAAPPTQPDAPPRLHYAT